MESRTAQGVGDRLTVDRSGAQRAGPPLARRPGVAGRFIDLLLFLANRALVVVLALTALAAVRLAAAAQRPPPAPADHVLLHIR